MKKISIFFFGFLLFLQFLFIGGVLGQVTVTNPTNTTPAMSATYTSLALAITDVNNRTAISGPVTITLDASSPQTAPAGGYSITNVAITGGSTTNRFVFDGGGNTITAPTPQTSGSLNDAIFKIIGADFITIQNFTMQENAANTTTTATSNNMTEFGVALFYASSTNGAQNNIIQNNTISLNRTYQNTFGIYSNSTHSATAITTSASATGTGGGNSGLKVYGNAISNVNNGILVLGPFAAADMNTGIDIGGSSSTTANTISNFGTTGTFSGYANVSGTVYGIFIRNSIGFNVSYNSITSSNGGVTAGTLRGIFNMSASNTPTGTFTNNINNNTIALTYGVASGTLQGITVEATNATTTSVGNINNNNFTALTASLATSATITAISTVAPHLTLSISGNTFTNLSTNTTGSFTFFGHSYTMPASGTQTLNNNSIVTAFNKTGAGGTVTISTSSTSSPNGTTHSFTNNNFSNITVTGATGITGVYNLDGASSSATRTVTGNTFNNWTGGTSAITGFSYGYIGGTTSTISNNTITNITGQSTITAISVGSSASLATTLNVANNTINNLSSTGTGGQVIGISCANTSTVININGNAINTLSSTGASSAVGGILITGAATTNVFSNTIYGMVASGITSPLALGVSVQGGTTVNTYGNKIYNISATGAISTTSPAVIGLNITGGTTVKTYNNLIGNLTAPNVNLADAIRGISIASTTAATSQNVYNNTVYLTGGSAGTNFGTSGIYHAASATATTAALDLQNNMIFNTCTPSGTGIVTAFRRSAAALGNYKSTSNKNLFYTGTPSATTTIMSDGTNNYQTLATFQTAVSTREANSFTESAFDPASYFVSTTGSNANYLQPASGITTQAEGGGNTITMCSPDYNGVTRPGFSGAAYDVGAWEFAGVSPAPVLTNMVPSPALTSQCTKAARIISIDITTASGTITGATLNYNHNGSAQTAVTMTNSSGTTWTGTMLAPSTGNATVTWSITATNSLGLNTLYSGTSYADEPNTGITATATATPSTICSGNTTSLNFSAISSQTVSGARNAPASTSNTTAFSYGLVFDVTTAFTLNSVQVYNGSSAGTMTIVLQNNSGTQLQTLTTPTIPSGTGSTPTTVSIGWNIPVGSGYRLLATTSPSLVRESSLGGFPYAVGSFGSITSGYISGTSTTYYYFYNWSVTPLVSTPSSYSWSDGSSVIGTSNPQTATPSGTPTYTCTATVNGCPMTAAVTPTVNPLPTAPTATPSSQCGAGIPTASVADNNSYSTPTFKWYSAATGGTLLQNSTSVTYTSSISVTTTFYVAVVGTNTCESARTAVTVTISQPDAISAVTSAAAICLGQSVTLTAANTATTPTQTYSYSWACATTGSGATSANTNNPASITPTVAGSYTYTVTASDGACSAVNTVAVTVNALPNITSATATPSAVCSGAAITLTGASVPSSSGTATVGSGSSTSTSAASNPFYGGYGGVISQYLIKASELTALNVVAGNISNIKFDVTAVGSPLSGLGISIGNTTLSALTSNIESNPTSVYYNASYTPVTGINTMTFSSPFNWDGVSNIIVSFCWSNNNTSNTATTLKVYSPGFTSSNARYVDSKLAADVCSYTGSATPSGWNGASTTSTSRPIFIFDGQIGTNQTASLSWSWNSTPAITTATGSTTETNTGASATSKTYTVTATNATTGCVNTATTSAITINPVTAAPTATNSSQCGTATPTCSVTGTGTSGNTFKWYLAATGGAALVGQSANTLSSYPVSATTSFYVSEFNTACESARVQVTVTVTAAPTITAAASVNPVCSGSASVLSVTSANSDYTYTWSNSAGTGASVSVNPTSATTYTVTGTDNSGGSNNGCSTSASIAITTNSLPSAVTLTPSTSTNLCMGDVKTIVASGGNSPSAGFAVLGTASTLTSAIEQPTAFCNRWGSYRMQTVYTASELQAIGLSAGNISSMAFNIATLGDASTNSGFIIKIGNTNLSILSGDFVSTTTGFTTVYPSQTYTHTATGWQTIPFSTSFIWDGISNIIVDLIHNGADLTNNSTTYFSATSGNTVAYTTTSSSGIASFSNKRLNVTFGGQVATPQPISWSPTTALFTNSIATTAYTGNPTTVYAKPTATTTYTATATNAAGCTSSASVAVTVATPSTQTLANNDYVWRGTTNTDWSTLTNWVKYDGAAYPVASNFPSDADNVFIPQINTCVVSQPSIGAGTVAAKNLFIESNATVTGGSGTLDVKGDFTNNGIFTPGTGTVSFTGTAAQQVTGATTFYNLTQNNTFGLTLNSPVIVSNGLTMTAGDITTSSTNLLTLGNSAPATLTWTNGKVVGPMKRWMAATTNSGASSSLFPLGNTDRKAQASIEYTTAPTTAGYLEAKFIVGNPTSVVAYPTPLTDQFNYVLNNVVTEGYWEIKPSVTNTLTDGAYTVTLEGDGINFYSTNGSYTDVRIIKSPVPPSSWILQGVHGTATGSDTDFTVSRTGMSGYSFFAMAFPSNAPLPIELVSFAANCEDNNTVSVNWTTASEHNSDYYTVEKSRDGISWNVLKTIPAAGNSTQLINYSVADVADISGTVYYRLTQVDIDGATKMYDVVSTNCSSESELSLIAYPNPSNGQFTVKIENALGGKYVLAITDMQGKAIEEQSLDLETGTTVVKLNPVGLQPGVYLLQFMQDGNMLQQQKLIIE